MVGQTAIELSDIEEYRSHFGLPANDPTPLLVPGSADPGVQSQSGDLAESDLDLELSGGIAPNVSIQFVYSTDVTVSLQYAIDQNLAPVISISYGDCELQTPSSQAQAFAAWAEQANAQGQTIFAAAGDDGALDCSGGDDTASNNSLSVDLPASLPYVTGVGGTTFAENGGNYWSSSNSSTYESALSYIPETAWNDGVCQSAPRQQTVCATGGGASVYFSKPSWQTGTGVPSDGARDVPDVSIAASPNHDAYIIYTGGQASEIGGTSAGSPQFSGMAILLTQYLISNGYQPSPGLGNINPAIYQNLAPVSGVFHDIATGSNMVPPCSNNTCSGTPMGFSAGPGYDQVTGWGTPDINKFITSWHSSGVTAKITVTMSLAASTTRPAFTDTVTLSASLTSSSTPGGTVAFTLGTETLGTAPVNGGAAALTINATQLAVGENIIVAEYSGDDSHFGAATSIVVIESTPSNGTPLVQSMSNSASYTQSFAPGGIVSIFGSQLAPATASAYGLPLPTMLAGTTVTIGGYTAALYYVSSTQLNVQIPYEVSTTGGVAAVRISNNGHSANTSFTPSAAAPAIFTTNASGSGQGDILDNASYQLLDSSHPAIPGSTYLQIYCMGLGEVTNPPADGSPASSTQLSKTSSESQVSIGGVDATAIFTGLAPGFVGLYQVNVQVPSSVAAGSAVPVSISIGGATSNTVTITVQ